MPRIANGGIINHPHASAQAPDYSLGESHDFARLRIRDPELFAEYSDYITRAGVRNPETPRPSDMDMPPGVYHSISCVCDNCLYQEFTGQPSVSFRVEPWEDSYDWFNGNMPQRVWPRCIAPRPDPYGKSRQQVADDIEASRIAANRDFLARDLA